MCKGNNLLWIERLKPYSSYECQKMAAKLEKTLKITEKVVSNLKIAVENPDSFY